MAREDNGAATQEASTRENEGQEAEARGQLTPQEIEEIQKASAGKDRKITDLTRRIQQLESAAGDDSVVAKVERLGEIAADLKARESELAAREKALNTAITEGVPISLMLRGTDDIDGTLAELKAFADTSYQRRLKPTGVPTVGGSSPRLTQSHLARMSAKELAAVPESVMARALEGNG